MRKIYLDNAATTPVDPHVADLMYQILQEEFGNPSSTHSFGRKVKAHLELSRKKIASLLNVTPAEIVFTSGGTEADNTILWTCVHDLGVKRIISSHIEHHAVCHTVDDIVEKGFANCDYVKILENGHVDLQHLEELLANSNDKTLVSLMHGNNETGNLLDLQKVSQLCKKYNALFHSDTVQTMGQYKFDFSNSGPDFAVGSAHKFNGPKGIGFFYHRKDLKIKPYITGGAQERELRAGTENIYGIAGMAKALEIAYSILEDKKNSISALKTLLINRIKKELPQIKFNGDPEGNSMYNILSIAFPPELSDEVLLFNFDLHGFAVSGGSACTSGSNTGSHVIRNIGVNLDRSPVRISLGKYNTKEDINQLVDFMRSLFEVPVAADV